MIDYSIEINIGKESASYSNEDNSIVPETTSLITVFCTLLETMGYSKEAVIEGVNRYLDGK